jgi:uncharacterized protein YbjT (DUF2867 family)
MRVLVLGAGGFIGAACVRRLVTEGVQVRAVARTQSGFFPEGVEWIAADITELKAAAWDRLVDGCDAVVNCAGVFDDSLRDSTRKVHVDAPTALYAACERKGARRVVLISAIGVDDRRTAFARTKKQGELALQKTALDWVILRPSIVIGRGAYGGGALLRGLGALPVLPLEQRLGRIQPVALDDVISTIIRMLEKTSPSDITLELAGPARLSMADAAAIFRRWMGWEPARRIPLPGWLAWPLYATGALANWLGWRTPLSWSGRKEMQRGAQGDPSIWERVMGGPATSLETFFSGNPADLQDRRFAAFYILKPVVFIVTILFWIGTGLISLGPGYDIGVELMEAGGAGPLSGPSVIAGGLADIAIGIGIAFRRTTRLALWTAIAMSLFYAIAGTSILPQLWADPIGPMLKIWPLIVLNLAALALLRER